MVKKGKSLLFLFVMLFLVFQINAVKTRTNFGVKKVEPDKVQLKKGGKEIQIKISGKNLIKVEDVVIGKFRGKKFIKSSIKTKILTKRSSSRQLFIRISAGTKVNLGENNILRLLGKKVNKDTPFLDVPTKILKISVVPLIQKRAVPMKVPLPSRKTLSSTKVPLTSRKTLSSTRPPIRPLNINSYSLNKRNLEIKNDGRLGIIVVNGRDLEKVTSAQVILNNIVVKNIKVELGVKKGNTREIKFTALPGAKTGKNLKLRLMAADKIIDIPTSKFTFAVEAASLKSILPDVYFELPVLDYLDNCSHKWTVKVKNNSSASIAGLALIGEERVPPDNWNQVFTEGPFTVSAGTGEFKYIVWKKDIKAFQARIRLERAGEKLAVSKAKQIPQVYGHVHLISIRFEKIDERTIYCYLKYSNTSDEKICSLKYTTFIHRPESGWKVWHSNMIAAQSGISSIYIDKIWWPLSEIDKFRVYVFGFDDPSSQWEYITGKTVPFDYTLIPGYSTEWDYDKVEIKDLEIVHLPGQGSECDNAYEWSATVTNNNSVTTTKMYLLPYIRKDGKWFSQLDPGSVSAQIAPGQSEIKSGISFLRYTSADDFKLGVKSIPAEIGKWSEVISLPIFRIAAEVTELEVTKSGTDYVTWNATLKNTSDKGLCKTTIKIWHRPDLGSWVLVGEYNVEPMSPNATPSVNGYFYTSTSSIFSIDVYEDGTRIAYRRTNF